MNLSQAIRKYFDLGVGASLLSLPTTMEIDGNLVPAAALQGVLGQMNTANTAGYATNFQTSAAAAITLTSLQALFQKLTNGGAVVVTLDAAYNIVNAIPNAFNGETFFFSIFSSGAGTVATPTLTDTAVTLSGTTSIVAGNTRQYQGQITQLQSTSGAALTAGTTFTSLTQVGTTNTYTVALGTNAISPTVGQVILINVTAGTLPSGWYPIVKVTSATSFVIAAPIAGTAWTATAATLPGTTVAPLTYSPLVTITAIQSFAAIV